MKQEIDDFYKRDYEDPNHIPNTRHIYHELKKLVKGDLLDLGSGAGEWLKLVGRGDSCDAYNDKVTYKLNLDEGFDIPKTYDTITSFGVIYYLSSPYKFLQSVKKHLKKDGLFIIGFNFRCDKHTFRVRYYFDELSARKTLEENGFEIIKTYRNALLSPKLNCLQWIWRLFSRQFIFYVCKVKTDG